MFHLWGIASSRKYGNMDWKFYQVSPLQFGLGQLNSFPTHSSAEKNLDSASSVTPIIANQKKKSMESHQALSNLILALLRMGVLFLGGSHM